MERRVAGSSTGSVAYAEREEAQGQEEPLVKGVVGEAEGLDPGELSAVAKTAMAAAISKAEVAVERQKNTETVSPQGKNTKSAAAAAAARVRYQPVFSLEEAQKVDELMGPRPVEGEEGKTKPGLMPTARSKNDVFRMSVLITHRLLLRQEEGFKLTLVKDGEAKALELIV